MHRIYLVNCKHTEACVSHSLAYITCKYGSGARPRERLIYLFGHLRSIPYFKQELNINTLQTYASYVCAEENVYQNRLETEDRKRSWCLEKMNRCWSSHRESACVCTACYLLFVTMHFRFLTQWKDWKIFQCISARENMCCGFGNFYSRQRNNFIYVYFLQ